MKKRNRNAYTFVELAIGLTLLAVVLLIVANLLRLTRVFSRGVVSREAAQEASLLALRKMADKISEASDITWPQAKNPKELGEFLVFRTFEEEIAFLYLDKERNAVVLRRAYLDQGKFKLVKDELLWKSPGFSKLMFGTTRGRSGAKQVQIAIQAGEEWFIDNVTTWNAGR
mgnify:CR=1 FL=1